MWKVMKLAFGEGPDELINLFSTEEAAEAYIEYWREYNFADRKNIVLFTEQI